MKVPWRDGGEFERHRARTWALHRLLRWSPARVLVRLSVAVGTFAVALGLAWALFPLIGREVGALFLLSAAVTAWVSSLWLALLVLLAAGVTLPYWFISPLHAPGIDTLEDGVSVVVFGLLGVGLSGLIARLHAAKHAAERHQQRRDALLRVAHRLAVEVDAATVLRSLADEAAALFPQAAVTVYRWDPIGQVLLPVAGIRLIDHLETRRLHLGEGLNGRVAAARATCVLEDCRRELEPTAPLRQAGARAGIGVPLLLEGRLLGTLAIGALSPAVGFVAEDVAVLELLASTATASLVGLERAQLDGVLLAARTAQHALNNQLGVVVGYADLAASDPRLPADLRSLVREMLTGAQQAAATVEQLRQTTRVEPVDRGGLGPVLDLRTRQPLVGDAAS